MDGIDTQIQSNLRMLIIDEFSMVRANMLYQLDLRLKELKQVYNQPFGGVSVLLFGDLLQLRQVHHSKSQEIKNFKLHIC